MSPGYVLLCHLHSYSYFDNVDLLRAFTIGLLLCNKVTLGRTSQRVVNMHLQHKPNVWSSQRSIKTPAWTRLVLSSNTRNCTRLH